MLQKFHVDVVLGLLACCNRCLWMFPMFASVFLAWCNVAYRCFLDVASVFLACCIIQCFML
jgi:hypothetical protein